MTRGVPTTYMRNTKNRLRCNNAMKCNHVQCNKLVIIVKINPNRVFTKWSGSVVPSIFCNKDHLAAYYPIYSVANFHMNDQIILNIKLHN